MIEIKKTDHKKTQIELHEFHGKFGVNIRDFINSDKYTGPAKEGFWIPVELWDAFYEAFTHVNEVVHKQFPKK